MPQAQQTPPDTITPVAPRKGVRLTINGKGYIHAGDPEMPLIWFLRDTLRLTGCKYGCDDGECGTCTVHVDGKRALACQLPMSDLDGHDLTTIEGLADERTGRLHPLQTAWVAEDAIACGYCQCGWIMTAADLLARKKAPSDADIDALPNTCRCGMQPRIRAAIKRAAADLAKGDDQ